MYKKKKIKGKLKKKQGKVLLKKLRECLGEILARGAIRSKWKTRFADFEAWDDGRSKGVGDTPILHPLNFKTSLQDFFRANKSL